MRLERLFLLIYIYRRTEIWSKKHQPFLETGAIMVCQVDTPLLTLLTKPIFKNFEYCQ